MFNDLFLETIYGFTIINDDTPIPVKRELNTAYFTLTDRTSQIPYSFIWAVSLKQYKNIIAVSTAYYAHPKLVWYQPTDGAFMYETDKAIVICYKMFKSLWMCRMQSKKITAYVKKHIRKTWRDLPVSFVSTEGTSLFDAYRSASIRLQEQDYAVVL